MKKKNATKACPCGGLPTGSSYYQCCAQYIDAGHIAPSAEHLMRSRYTAYTLARADYLRASWHPDTRPTDLVLEAPDAPHGTRWLGLTVHAFREIDDTHAEVGFTARYREAGRAHRLTETSRFLKENGHWLYVDGIIENAA